MHDQDLIRQIVKDEIQRHTQTRRHGFRAKLENIEVDADGNLHAQITGYLGEVKNRVELFQQYGFFSNPPVGTELVVVPIGGNSNHNIIAATQHGSYRPNKDIATGEHCLYDQWGKIIHFPTGKYSDGAFIAIGNLAKNLAVGKSAMTLDDVLYLINNHYHINVKAGSDVSGPATPGGTGTVGQGDAHYSAKVRIDD